MEKMKDLKSQGMERLVLDLRSNPGGVMQSAIRIADEMLGSGMMILKTKGRDPSINNEYRATSGDMFEEQPVIVLVNRGSASASEILAGALQDHDRALLVGERTFGKALVQKQFELNDGSMLQMTVGRYYTPVGRLIQTPYTDGDREEYYEAKYDAYEDALFNPSKYKDSIPDSLSYETDHGRTVFGGGGILPDYIVKPDTSSIERFVSASGLSAAFVINWFPEVETEMRQQWGEQQAAFATDYRVSDKTIDEFWTYAEDKGMKLTTVADSVNRSKGIFPESEAEEAKEYVRTYLKGNIARQMYGSNAMYPIFNSVNPTFQQAMSLWDRAEQLSEFHMASSASTSGRN
jgi:carboxyl-terminal processing protease